LKNHSGAFLPAIKNLTFGQLSFIFSPAVFKKPDQSFLIGSPSSAPIKNKSFFRGFKAGSLVERSKPAGIVTEGFVLPKSANFCPSLEVIGIKKSYFVYIGFFKLLQSV
jgi:hypothetical protein